MHTGTMRSGLYMPVSGRLNPDVGILVEADIEGPPVGSEVIVKPYDGKWLDNWHEGRQLRLYGVVTPWHSSIVAVRTPIGLEPTWDWVLLKREDAPNHRLLPDHLRYAEGRATVEGFGPKVSMLPLGAKVVYRPGLDKNALKFAFGIDPAYILVREKELLAQIVED